MYVGVLWSIGGNLPHLLQRFTSHSRAICSVLHAGLARGHRGNPAASLRVEQLYGIPVLLSCTASLLLKQTEFKQLDAHFKKKLIGPMKLYDLTSDSVVYFLAGSLPASALLHIRQLGLFCMISRVPNNILHRIAKHVLITVRDNSKSWFIHIKSLCQQCSLPHPLLLLDSPLTKIAAKKLIKAKVTDFWEKKLRHESTLLPSLTYFKPSFMSLTTHHPLWTTCQDNPFELSKCLIQSKLLSGRYRTDRLLWHFDKNRTMNCSRCLNGSDGSLEHLLVLCPALTQCCD